MFRYYIKSAIRNLWKKKAFTAINLLGLGLGLSATMVLGEMLYRFTGFDTTVQSNSLLAYLKTKSKDGNETNHTTYPLLYEALKTCPQIEAGTHLQSWYNPWLKYGDQEVQEDRCFFVDTGFFNVFSFPLKYGSTAGVLADKYNVVLSEETAQQLFGRQDPVGKIIMADDSVQLTVKAVLKHIGAQNSVRPQVLLTTAFLNDAPGFRENANWYNGFAQNYIRLKNGTDTKKLESQLDELVLLNYHPERKSDKILVATLPHQPAPLAESMINNWLQYFSFRINLTWWMLVPVALLLLIIVAVPAGYQRIKAALANPVQSLRTE